MQPLTSPEQGAAAAAELSARMEGLVAGQSRVEALLLGIRGDLGVLAARVDEVRAAQCPGNPPVQAAAPPVEEGAPVQEEGREAQEAGCEEGGEGSVEFSAPEATDAQRALTDSADEVFEPPSSLPSHWPASVAVRWSPGTLDSPCWSSSYQSSASQQRRRGSAEKTHELGAPWERHDDDGGHEGSTVRVLIDPNSNVYSAYSAASFLMLLSDLLLVPYMIAWDLELQSGLLVMAVFSCVFWTADIGVNFASGYSQHGRLEMRPLPVARRYARSWLLPDLAIVSSDWLGLVLALSTSQSVVELRGLRLVKLGKLVRLLGLLRMMKVLRAVEDAVARSLSDGARTCLQALLIVCGTFLLNHLLGCAWFLIGREAPSDTGMRWIDLTTDWKGEAVPFLATGRLHQYVVSFHWSLVQFTMGSMDVGAYNSVERAFSIFCLAVGVVFGSTLISILSAGMVDQQMARKVQTERVRKLHLFLRERRISRGLAALVQQQAQERLAAQPRLQEEDVAALQLLSRDLRTALRHETFREPLGAHGLFRLWEDMCPSTTRELCMEAMGSSALRARDELFAPGASAAWAHHLASGRATYSQEPETAPVLQARALPVEAGAWLCEAALWSHWVHVGTARAREHCQVVSISAERLAGVLARHALVREISAEYCRNFHRRVAEARPPLAAWPSDLEVPFTDYSEMVASMSAHLRVAIGLRALEQRQGRRQPAQEGLARLRQEVEAGRCTLLVGARGQLQRVVSIVPVRLEDARGRVLAEVGRVGAGARGVEAGCRLPAAKQQAGEVPGAAYARVLRRLGLQRGGARVLRIARELEWGDSRAYGVRTKYLRTVHHARLPGELPAPALALARAASLPPELQRAPFYKTEDDGRSVLYTWLDQQAFEHYATPAGERELDATLAVLCQQNLRKLAI